MRPRKFPILPGETGAEYRRRYQREYMRKRRKTIREQNPEKYEETKAKDCIYAKSYYWANRNSIQAKYHRSSREWRYGITWEDYTEMLIAQAGLCYMCGKQMTGKTEPNLDHDHITGAIRALLCTKCNMGLHFIENTEFIKNAERYLMDFIQW